MCQGAVSNDLDLVSDGLGTLYQRLEGEPVRVLHFAANFIRERVEIHSWSLLQSREKPGQFDDHRKSIDVLLVFEEPIILLQLRLDIPAGCWVLIEREHVEVCSATYG